MIATNLIKFTDAAIATSKNPAVKRAAYILAALAFAVGLYASYTASPELVSNLKWKPFLIVLLIGMPLTQITNAVEMILLGRLVGQTFSFFESLRISIIGGAANMMPLPGGTLVRVAALKARGARIVDGVRVTLAVGVIWIGVAFLYSGIWMYPFNTSLALFMGFGGACSLGLGIWLGIKQCRQHMVIAQIILLKLFATVLDSARLMFCLWAIGSLVSFSIASTLAAASVTGSAVSIVPAGLGVREGMSAVLASFAGLTAATGFLASALNRFAGLAMLFPAALILSVMEIGKAAK